MFEDEAVDADERPFGIAEAPLDVGERPPSAAAATGVYLTFFMLGSS